MNVNTDAGKETEMADKKAEHDDDPGKGHDHASHDGVKHHHHVDEEDCALDTDVRTVHLN
jgi:hypothetical protein